MNSKKHCSGTSEFDICPPAISIQRDACTVHTSVKGPSGVACSAHETHAGWVASSGRREGQLQKCAGVLALHASPEVGLAGASTGSTPRRSTDARQRHFGVTGRDVGLGVRVGEARAALVGRRVRDPRLRRDRDLALLDAERHFKRRRSLAGDPSTNDARVDANGCRQIKLRPLKLLEARPKLLCRGRRRIGHE